VRWAMGGGTGVSSKKRREKAESSGRKGRADTNGLDVRDVVVEHSVGNSESLGDLYRDRKSRNIDQNREEEGGRRRRCVGRRADLGVSERDPLLDLSVGLSVRSEETRVGSEGSD